MSDQIRRLAAARWRVAASLTAAMMLLYFGFILLVAYDKALLTRVIVPGLSIGILLGALVIVAAWVLMLIYVHWANRHHDDAVTAIREGR
ncbi:MAG TPA: DUF485 domain-containing protein [Vicinamibacterales bacterium]